MSTKLSHGKKKKGPISLQFDNTAATKRLEEASICRQLKRSGINPKGADLSQLVKRVKEE